MHRSISLSVAVLRWRAPPTKSISSFDHFGVALRISAPEENPVEVAGQVPLQRARPVHGRRWVETGISALAFQRARQCLSFFPGSSCERGRIGAAWTRLQASGTVSPVMPSKNWDQGQRTPDYPIRPPAFAGGDGFLPPEAEDGRQRPRRIGPRFGMTRCLVNTDSNAFFTSWAY